MKNYRVCFSFYSEENGNFDTAFYNVEADNQFEARRAAWLLRDKDDDIRFQSCVQQCGVTWDASPLDLRDFLNAQAANNKCWLRQIMNVDIPNAALCNSSKKEDLAQRERAYFTGSLEAVRTIAQNVGKAHDLDPPDIYEELAYAWQFVSKLDELGRHNQAAELGDRIDFENKWDIYTTHLLKELFDHGYIQLCGETVILSEHFGRDGVYPVWADVNDHSFLTYKYRWERAREIERVDRLPMFGERDVIKGSAEAMPFDYRTLVLRSDALNYDYQKAENILWTPHHDADGMNPQADKLEPNTRFYAENMITGVVAAFRRIDFAGVLRPDHAKNINFAALKDDYAEFYSPQSNVEFVNSDADNADDWDQEV